MNLSNLNIQEYLQNNGFIRYENYSFPLNRWEKKVPNGWGGMHASITLNAAGNETEYGFIFWETSDQVHDLIQKRKFECSLSLDDLKHLLDFNYDQKKLPKSIHIYPINE